MEQSTLFNTYNLAGLALNNKMVMAPMTRCRALGNIPNELIAEYYKQRSGAGLIITEGTTPSANGLGYARMPGVFTEAQIAGWQKVTDAVHAANSKIFLQLMHCGRIAHSYNMPEGAKVIAPSAVQAAGQMWTDSHQMQDHPVPQAMTAEDISQTRAEFVQGALNAIKAGFDGVELHGANGYLLEQFLSPIANVRTDEYGGTIENRCRFVLEVVADVAAAIGKEKTAIRLSPYGVASDMPHYPEIHETYDYLSNELNKLGIAYIHLVDHSAMGAPAVPVEVKQAVRNNFKNTLIMCGGYDKAHATADLNAGICDLAAFGRPFINNPDLVNRLQNDYPLSTDFKGDMLYTADEKGYTDYPVYEG
jgi:N-ethylmaleimide reductase